MIQKNAALYIGIVTACVLDRCPDATVHTERRPGSYEMTCMRKVGVGTEARSVFDRHTFFEAETAAVSANALTESARVAGETIGVTLAAARA
jgi:hypothetical protein